MRDGPCLRSHCRLSNTPSLRRRQIWLPAALCSIVLAREPICVSIYQLEELVQGTLLRMTAANFGNACGNPQQIGLATVQLFAGLPEPQSLRLLPRAKASLWGVKPKRAQRLLIHGWESCEQRAGGAGMPTQPKEPHGTRYLWVRRQFFPG